MFGKKRSCLRCKNYMERGFMLDCTDSGYYQAQWVGGEPKRSYWGNLCVKKKKMLSVDVLRCTRCGYLELFANSA